MKRTLAVLNHFLNQSFYLLKKWGVLFLIILILVMAGIKRECQFQAAYISKKDALEDYDYMWNMLENNYPLLDMAERKYSLSMDALKENYRNQIDALNDKINFEVYYSLLQSCIEHFQQLGHLSVLTPAQVTNIIHSTELAEQNHGHAGLDQYQYQYRLCNDPFVKARYDFLEDLQEHKEQTNNVTPKGAGNLEFKEINEETGYVKIKSFNTRHLADDAQRLDNWFKHNSGRKNMIIDITGNGGGTSQYWQDLIVAPNINEEFRYGFYYITQYGEETREQFAIDGVYEKDLSTQLDDLLYLPEIDEKNLQKVTYYGTASDTISPSGEYKNSNTRFFLLVDRGVYSAADTFAMFCKETGFATVIGENTGGDGAGLNVYLVKLPKSNLLIRFRAMHGLNVDGSSNIEFGTTPDVIFKGVSRKNVSYLGVCMDYIESLEE